MTPSTRRAQFRKLELKVAFAPRGKKMAALEVIRAERLKDLRAKAEVSCAGWVPQEPEQGEMFAGRSA